MQGQLAVCERGNLQVSGGNQLHRHKLHGVLAVGGIVVNAVQNFHAECVKLSDG